MESSRNTRKSCDFCYLRKIKCDAQKPRCSHCVTYETDCTYSAPSRKSRPKKQRNDAKIEESTGGTQARFKHLEALLEQLTRRLEAAEKQNEDQAQTQTQPQAELQGRRPISTMPLLATGEDGGADDYEDNPPQCLNLPPLQQVLPTVQIFLRDFNAVLPLFHPETLLRLVHNVYRVGPQQRDPVEWAAINVVLALTHRQGLMGISNIKHSAEYFRRAQSVLSAVALGDVQLLNVQVLVGMVMLSQGSPDHQPALILIATTMRLAHKIGLHNRASSAQMDPILTRQRARVFWLAYILDRDLAMFSMQPSIQLDDDIDLDLPFPDVAGSQIESERETDDTSVDAGSVTTADGSVTMHYFVARIQLAVIEGGVYDYVYSTRAQKRSPEERSRALESVASALEQWKASIPPEFSAAEALRRVNPRLLRFFGVLHSTSLSCATLISRAHAWNAQWVASLRRYGKDGTVPLLPPQWEALVDDARDLLLLLGTLGPADRWNFWTTGCSSNTALVLLTANSLHRPQHDNVATDSRLVDAGLQTLDKMLEETGAERLRSFREICAELNQDVQRRRVEATLMANRGDFSSAFPDTPWVN